MSRMLFVNLAVKDLGRTVDFWKQLGFEFNAQFTDDNAACLIISDEAMVMLLREPFYASFTKKQLADPTTTSETILAMSADSREEVDELVNKAIAAGGSPANDPIEQGGFMYGWSFHDPDGHQWEPIWMDPSAIAG